ncbi:MAG: type II secretion system F family protein [Candidatus Altiarchaeota archaeon]
MSFITFIARIMPKPLKDKYAKMVHYSTIKTDPDKFIGGAITVGLMLSFIITMVLGRYGLGKWPLPVFLASFILVEFAGYIIVSLSANSKARQVEEALPDALQLMGSNIRAGLTTDKALLMAARPEFGALEEEIRRIGKETMAGKSLVDALDRMSDNINSKDLERTIELIVHSIKSGGQLADLLDKTASDIRDQQIIKKEISASVLMYVMFIFIALGIGAPALFAMSSFLVKLLTQNMKMIADEMPSNFDAMGGAPISPGSISITPEFISQYSYLSMAVSCIFGSMVIGLILRGEEKEGLKYIPILIGLCFGLFYVGNLILEMSLGSMMM